MHAGLPTARPGQPFLPGPVLASAYHLPPDPAGSPPGGVVPDPVGSPPDAYGRPDNPTRRALEAAIGDLEGGGCLAFASGLGAVSAVLLAVLRPGDTVVLPADGYHATRALADTALRPQGVTVLPVPTAGPYPSFDGVRLVLLETLANPGLDVCEIPAVAAAARAAGALVLVDNSTVTPLGQRPLDLGADVVAASGTKALTGHSDLLMGYVCTRDAALLDLVRTWRDRTGGIPGAFDAWLAHRSLGTLDLRLARQAANAAAVARLLAGRDGVRDVRHPGLDTDPGYPAAGRLLRRLPGILAFTLPSAAHVSRFLAAARLVYTATSFGGLHTTADRRARWGDAVPEGFVRLSCGVEDTADLVADIDAALAAALPPGWASPPPG